MGFNRLMNGMVGSAGLLKKSIHGKKASAIKRSLDRSAEGRL